MTREELIAELHDLAERSGTDHPSATGVLLTLLGALRLNDEDALLEHLYPWAKAAHTAIRHELQARQN